MGGEQERRARARGARRQVGDARPAGRPAPPRAPPPDRPSPGNRGPTSSATRLGGWGGLGQGGGAAPRLCSPPPRARFFLVGRHASSPPLACSPTPAHGSVPRPRRWARPTPARTLLRAQRLAPGGGGAPGRPSGRGAACGPGPPSSPAGGAAHCVFAVDRARPKPPHPGGGLPTWAPAPAPPPPTRLGPGPA